MPCYEVKRELLDRLLGLSTSNSQSSTSHQEAGENDQPSIHTTALNQSHLGMMTREPISTTKPLGPRLGRGTPSASREDQSSSSLRAQRRRNRKPLQDILNHIGHLDGNVQSSTNPPQRPDGPLPKPSAHATAPSLHQRAATARAQIKEESPQRSVIQAPVRQPVVKREPRHFRDSWPDLTPQEARRLFQPVFGRATLLQAREARHSRSSNWNRGRRTWHYNDWDRPSEDALGPRYRLRYSESPRAPRRVHIKDEPLDGHTPDMKAQVNPWVQYAGPSPFSLLPETSRPTSTPLPKPIKQEPQSVPRASMLNLQQRKRELSSDEDEPVIKRSKRQPVAGSKRPSSSDDKEERPLKRSRGPFQYQRSQDGTKGVASVDDGMDDGEILMDIPGRKVYARGADFDGEFRGPHSFCFDAGLGFL